MPVVQGRKRRTQTEASEDSDGSPSPRPRRRTNNREPLSDSSADEGGDSYEDRNGATQTQTLVEAHGSREQMVKKMVRLALASEYSRQVIRRADISAKVLGEHGGRQFKQVFDAAQTELIQKFGMQMVEQPMKEKVTISQRRAAQKTENPTTTSKTWTLISILPSTYKSRLSPPIIPPPKAPSTTTESTYIALYTFLISLISLSGGTIPEAKLERYLKRTNADQYTPIDRTEKLLTRLCKEGYLVKNRDATGGEEVVEYMVGPRGKTEVGDQGVAGLVRSVYGKVDVEAEELERRLERSLGIEEGGARRKQEKEKIVEGNGKGKKVGRSGRRRARDDDDEEEEEEVVVVVGAGEDRDD